VSDHYHGEYAEARHDHRGEYAAERHDHDLEYADKHHGHYDLDREVKELRDQVRTLRATMIEFGLELSEAQGRIHQLEQQTPQARQLELEADQAAADLAESESWRSTLADYAVASGAAGYDDEDDDQEEAGEQPFALVPRLRRVTCTRIVVTDGNPEPCGLPVDHDPDEKCSGNPHARPAPESSQS
jgi:hypothetical protein